MFGHQRFDFGSVSALSESPSKSACSFPMTSSADLVLANSASRRSLRRRSRSSSTCSAEYCDLAPAQVWARLLDDGVYLCSISTMYRLLAVAGENRERRRQRTHPARQKPELIAR